jgi:predicted O-methyltransferase YrrM
MRSLNSKPQSLAIWTRLARALSLSQLRRLMWQRSAHVRHILGWASSPAPHGTPDTLFAFADINLGIAQLPDEVQRFHAFLRDKSPRVVCEIGTSSGGHFYMLSRSLATLTTLIGVDLRVRNRAFLRLLAPDNLDIHLIDGDSRSIPVRNAVERAGGGQGLDVLIIDGDHTYDGVRSDYLSYRDLVRDGGVIAFHDIVEDHWTRFRRKTDSWTGDVPLFWSRLKPHARTVEFVADPEQDGSGIGVLIHSATMPIPLDF